MNRFTFLVLFLTLLAAFGLAGEVHAAGPGLSGEPFDAPALCPADIYAAAPPDCLPAGPSAYLSQMAAEGMTLPLQPLPASQPSPDLMLTPYLYVSLPQGQTTPIYATLEDALANSGAVQYIEAGALRYLSYIQEAYTDGEKPAAFMLRSGGWVSAVDVGFRARGTNRFQGLVFHRTPDNEFGWVLPINTSIRPRKAPGYQAPEYTNRDRLQYEVIQIYGSQKIGETVWYRIGPDEWVEDRAIGKVSPDLTPPPGISGSRWISINLYEQTLAVYDGGQLVFATLIASGMDPFFTRPGAFQIYKKLETTPMGGTFAADRSDYYYLQDVPFTMYYDQARALHAAYWRARMGYSQSHGCINMTVGDARWLFDWANEGDWVYVWDPSGETPTDPNYYGDGGA